MSDRQLPETLAAEERGAEEKWLTRWLSGPTRACWMSLRVQVGDAAPDLAVVASRQRQSCA